ncbi:MAG TPA: Nif3-like dinuclear metal center hexameric protein [Gemmatimonadota bacterium]|nr:Nif3-like dinuclear metal center hexameric protein [Gemmatimonadota bacterium]
MTPGAARDALVAYLDTYLDVAGWADKSLNGLQVEGTDEVRRIALATDAALATISLAAEARCQMLVVHHGLFWGRVEPVTGPLRARLAALIEAGLSLYASHLPLDAHPDVGNNAVLAGLLGLEDREPFGRWGDRAIGVLGRLPEPVDRTELAGRIEALLGAPADVLAFGVERVRSVAVVSGAAAELIPEAKASGADVFVTGETSHTAFHQARERGMNVVFAGHYATETLGVRALGDHLAERFGLGTVFLDAPTGY